MNWLIDIYRRYTLCRQGHHTPTIKLVAEPLTGRGVVRQVCRCCGEILY